LPRRVRRSSVGEAGVLQWGLPTLLGGEFVRKADSQTVKRLTYDELGKIVTYYWGRKVVYQFELRDQVLFLTELPEGRTRTYTRLEKVPAEVEVKPRR
jgi:hypothetical protein